jgi:hypothetical protein
MHGRGSHSSRKKMITPPDETYTTAEAASLIGISERQCARYLNAGLIRGTRPNGRWRITALAIWRHLGVEQEMMALWLEYCRQAGNSTPAEASEPPQEKSTA